MPRVARVESGTPRRLPPALTIEDQEDRLISKAMALIERQIDEGTVSAQVLSQFAKAGSSNAKLEKERLIEENKLLKAKTSALESASKMEELYALAIKAMSSYGGGRANDEDYDEYNEVR